MTDPSRPVQTLGAGAVGEGDDRAFRELFESECAYVVRLLGRLGVPERDRPDVAHEVFMIAHRHWATCDRERPMRPWLYGITFRVARDYRKLARVRHEVGGEVADVHDEQPSAQEALEAEQRRRLVADGLDALDFDRRSVFVMHDLEGLSMPAIAEALGIALNTGYSRLRLARADFTAYIKRARARDAV